MNEQERLWSEVGRLSRRIAELEAQERIGASASADYALDSDKVDGLHAAESGEDAHVLATDAGGNVQVDGHLLMPAPGQRRIEVPGVSVTRYGVIEAVVRRNLTRATGTPVFTITTTDETGDVDAGSYQVKIEGVVHAAGGNASSPSSSRGFARAFTRTMAAAGIGSNSAVKTVYDTDAASTDAGVREVAVPFVNVVETSEYVQVVTINCDVTGSGPVNPVVTLFVRVAWGSFITAPVLAVV